MMGTGDYVIVIEGESGEDLLSEFAPLRSTVARGVTILYAKDVDQAALHGLLERSRALGLTLVDVHREGQSS